MMVRKVMLDYSLNIFTILMLLEVLLASGNFTGTIVQTKAGLKVTLVCPYRSTTDHLHWLGPANLTVYTNNEKINPNIPNYHRFSLSGNYSRGQYNLIISNSTFSDEGVYQCLTTYEDKTVSQDFFIRLLRKPKVRANDTVQNLYTKVGEVTMVCFLVEGYPIPTISWTMNQGGKLGIWNVTQTTELYRITSTILPLEDNHLGLYKVLFRNSVGSIEVSVLLLDSDTTVSITTESNVCTASNDIVIKCNLHKNNNILWTSTWKHFRQDVYIRSLKGNTSSDISVLLVPHCDYQDTGKYTCTWMSNTTNISSSTTITVEGIPIITEKQLIEDKELITLSLRFHSSIALTQVNWYTDDTRVRTHRLYSLSITNITVYLLCYGVKVLIQGSRADLALHVNSQMTFNKISCQIQNAYGSAESSFSYDDIQKLFHPRSKITFVSLPKVFTTELRQINVSDIPILEGQGVLDSKKYFGAVVASVSAFFLITVVIAVAAIYDFQIRQVMAVGSAVNFESQQHSLEITIGAGNTSFDHQYESAEMRVYQSVFLPTSAVENEEPTTSLDSNTSIDSYDSFRFNQGSYEDLQGHINDQHQYQLLQWPVMPDESE